MTKDSTQTIFKSAAKFFSGTLLSRISGLLRDICLAFAFGTQGTLATFLIAFRFSHLARRLFGEGSLQSAFIPHFEEERLKGQKNALLFFKDTAYLLSLALVAFISIATIGLSLSFSYFKPENQELLFYTLIMLPSLFFICLYGLNTALLECEKSYFTPSIAPVAFNLTWILASLIIGKLFLPNAMFWLSIAVIVGSFAQWAITVPKVLSLLKRENIPLSFSLSSNIRPLIKPFLLANLGVAASQINNALDPLFARFASSEGPAWLWYAIRVQQLPLSLFAIALSGALLPPLSRAIRAQNRQVFGNFLHFSCTQILTLMVPFTAALFCLGPSIINLLFGRGEFQNESITWTTHCLWGYAAGLSPMALTLLIAPAFYSLSNYSTPSKASIFSMILNVFLNTLFIFVFKFNAQSVAWSTSLASLFNAGMLLFALSREGFSLPLLKPLAKITFCSGLAALSTLLFDNGEIFTLLKGQIPLFSNSLMPQLAQFTTKSLCFTAVLFSCAYLLNVKEMTSFFSKKKWVSDLAKE